MKIYAYKHEHWEKASTTQSGLTNSLGYTFHAEDYSKVKCYEIDTDQNKITAYRMEQLDNGKWVRTNCLGWEGESKDENN